MKKEFVSKQDLGVAYFPITILHKIIMTRITINWPRIIMNFNTRL